MIENEQQAIAALDQGWAAMGQLAEMLIDLSGRDPVGPAERELSRLCVRLVFSQIMQNLENARKLEEES